VSQPPPNAEPPEDEAHRNLVNLLAAIFVIILAIAAIWVVRTLDERRRLENCLASGRRDCLELIEPAAGR
jgi:cytochrome b